MVASKSNNGKLPAIDGAKPSPSVDVELSIYLTSDHVLGVYHLIACGVCTG
ncbi:hypothetical protein SORDD24_00106 [Streptococcus oralis]|uniref:Uncharacterized protein n=1 Tax=Streptococcus oralis TaxID=1303 RepID=A0A139QVG5_STROR|nr:hypothetical protein SORDD24_00106 [Streptococcus oralis]